jgi:hypothetical protein
MKKYFFISMLICSLIANAQTSEVYSYISKVMVNTGTGERELMSSPMNRYYRFTADKSICYETDPYGKKKSEIYKDRDKGGISTASYNTNGSLYMLRFFGEKNGVLVYKGHFTGYKHGSMDLKGNWTFSDFEEFDFYIYFSPDYSKLNVPGYGEIVYSYDRIYPDKKGSPTQIW